MDQLLIERVLQLPPLERGKLLDVIALSLDVPDPQVDGIWLDEAQRRLVARQNNPSRGIPASEVLGDP